MKKKSNVSILFPKFKALVEKFFATTIISIYTDNGGEYLSLYSFLSERGISHITTPPHRPELNGTSERKHRHIVETGLTLLHNACMPLSYWSYAFITAVYLINRLPTPLLQYSSPYEKLFFTTPNYSKLRVFGCLCYPWLRPYTSNKLQPKSQPCVFLGYSTSQSAFKCMDPKTGKVYHSRHVKFIENIFPFATLDKSNPVQSHTFDTWSSYSPSSSLPPIFSGSTIIIIFGSSDICSHFSLGLLPSTRSFTIKWTSFNKSGS